jgi:hypothetical protein
MFQIKDYNQRGEFIVRVSKYNNKFEIFLRVGVKEYPLKKRRFMLFLQLLVEEKRKRNPIIVIIGIYIQMI